jgi:hypothetical protein
MEEREARNEGIVIEEDAYEESADNGCSALMMVLTSILVWYSAHCFLSGTPHHVFKLRYCECTLQVYM